MPREMRTRQTYFLQRNRKLTDERHQSGADQGCAELLVQAKELEEEKGGRSAHGGNNKRKRIVNCRIFSVRELSIDFTDESRHFDECNTPGAMRRSDDRGKTKSD